MKKALIVDDEKMIVNSLLLGFPWAEHGFEVVATASGGREALALIDALRPDVVFTDVKMPGMTGLELMRKARERAPGTVFVVISGHAEFGFAREALALGAAAYCLKPLENDEIAAALVKAGQRLSRDEALRNAALLRFLTDPDAKNADALLSPYGENGVGAVALSLGDALPLLSGNLWCADFALDETCRLYLFSRAHAYLESPAFRASLLGAASAGRVRAFVYEETDAPSAFLRERLGELSDQLYAGFFAPGDAPLGRAQPPAPGGEARVDALAALCNKNRPQEVLLALRALSRETPGRLRMRDALRVNALCEALLSRLRDRPAARPLRYGHELAARYASFSDMLAALIAQLQRAGGAAADPDRLHNETLARVVRELNQTFTQDVSFQALCARHRINPSYLSQLFKKELDVTFTGYRNRLRVEYAKELLETTAILVGEISDRVGCESYLSFTKLFKRETGISPKQYRAKSRGEAES